MNRRPPCDRRELERALEETMLARRPIGTAPIIGSPEPAFYIDCDVAQGRVEWEAARALVPRTGRWPIMIWGVDGFDNLLARRYGFSGPGDMSIDGIIDRSSRIAAADAIGFWSRRSESEPLPEVADGTSALIDRIIASTNCEIGSAPTPADALAALGADMTERQLERWLLDWEEAACPGATVDGWHMTWFEELSDPYALAFLPTDDGVEVPAYIDFWGAPKSPEVEHLVALLRAWRDRFGAELVSHYGTMLQFVVGRPPTEIESAWQLALEHEAVAPCTTRMPGVALRDHARVLIGRDTWHLHERP